MNGMGFSIPARRRGVRGGAATAHRGSEQPSDRRLRRTVEEVQLVGIEGEAKLVAEPDVEDAVHDPAPSRKTRARARWRTVGSRRISSTLVHAFVRMNGAGPFVHDPLDSVSAAAALGAASEAGIDLAHAGPSRLFCNY